MAFYYNIKSISCLKQMKGQENWVKIYSMVQHFLCEIWYWRPTGRYLSFDTASGECLIVIHLRRYETYFAARISAI